MQFSHSVRSVLVTALCIAPAAFGADHDHPHEAGDVRPYVAGGQIFTGFYNDAVGDTSFRPDVRVFAVEFGENPDAPFSTEVGINPGSGFTGGQIRFSLTGRLDFWDGIGDVNFAASPDGTSLVVGSANTATATGAGITYSQAGAQSVFLQNVGASHAHAPIELEGNTLEGIYALELVIRNLDTNGNPLNTASLPAYLLFNNGASEVAHGEAIEFYEANVVPEPTALAVVGLGAMTLLRRRRTASRPTWL